MRVVPLELLFLLLLLLANTPEVERVLVLTALWLTRTAHSKGRLMRMRRRNTAAIWAKVLHGLMTFVRWHQCLCLCGEWRRGIKGIKDTEDDDDDEKVDVKGIKEFDAG